MGLEFVKWVLGRAWFGRSAWSEKTDGRVWVRGNNVQPAWEEIWRQLDPQTMKKLKYYKRYMREGMEPEIQLYGAYADTTHDNEPEYYAEMARLFDAALAGGEGVGEGVGACRGRIELSGALREALARGEPFDERYAGDVMHPVEEVLGFRLFLGGIDCVTYEAYKERLVSG